VVLPVLVPPIVALLGRGGVTAITEVADSLGLATEVALNGLLASGILGGDV
jgi:hypothetical protein